MYKKIRREIGRDRSDRFSDERFEAPFRLSQSSTLGSIAFFVFARFHEDRVESRTLLRPRIKKKRGENQRLFIMKEYLRDMIT